MKTQRQATSLIVFKTAGNRRSNIHFGDTAISPLILSPFDKIILKVNEKYVTASEKNRKLLYIKV